MIGSKTRLAALPALLALAACDETAVSAPTVTVSEAVIALAAPFQDLTTAHVRPEDGCYWYTHQGPVESTELPLRTRNGNPICTR